MIHINGGAINPAFIELAHVVKGTSTMRGESNYYVDIEPRRYYLPTEKGVMVRFNSGEVDVWGGSDADAIIAWYGIEIPEGMLEGPAPIEVEDGSFSHTPPPLNQS